MEYLLRHSGLLFANPSFVGGASRCLDIGSTQTMYNNSPSGDIADYNALMADWNAIGNDMNMAIKNFEQEYVKDAR